MISNCPNVGTAFTNGVQLCNGWMGGRVDSQGKYLVWPVPQNLLGVGC